MQISSVLHGIILLFSLRYSRNQDFLSTEDLTLFLEAEQGVGVFDRKKNH